MVGAMAVVVITKAATIKAVAIKAVAIRAAIIKVVTAVVMAVATIKAAATIKVATTKAAPTKAAATRAATTKVIVGTVEAIRTIISVVPTRMPGVASKVIEELTDLIDYRDSIITIILFREPAQAWFSKLKSI